MAYQCNAITKLSDAEVEWLTADQAHFDAWAAEWRERIADPVDGFRLFLENFASHEPADGAGPQPLDPWPFQSGLMAEALTTEEAIIMVKPRRMGATVIYEHYLVWVAAFRKDTPGARCLAISKEFRAAKKLLKDCKRILRLCPSWLLPTDAWGASGRGSDGKPCAETQEELGFARGSTIVSLPANGAARGETARVVLWDEAARIEGGSNDTPQEVAEGSLPTIEGGGQLIVSSTGQGRSGRGEVFARLWDQATDPHTDSDFHPIFIHWRERPGRDDKFLQRKINELGERKARQEYPSSPEEALMGDAEGLRFIWDHIKRSSMGTDEDPGLGAIMDDLVARGAIDGPDDGLVPLGIDWGGTSAGVVVWPLPGHRLYIADEYVGDDDSTEEFTRKLLNTASRYGTVRHAFFDSAGKQSMRSFRSVAGGQIRRHPVPFAKFKRLCIDHLEFLLARSYKDDGQVGIIISPRCKVLLKQMSGIERSDDGMVKKGDDHALDALLAALMPYALEWHRKYGE